jgi:hypothetical protein
MTIRTMPSYSERTSASHSTRCSAVIVYSCSRSGRGIGPGQADGLDSFEGGVGGRVCTKLGGDYRGRVGGEEAALQLGRRA